MLFRSDELQIVKLDNQDEALIDDCAVLITDNYVLTYSHHQTPYKLFDKNGRFLAAIGRVGKGANEYKLIYDRQLDEQNQWIYLMPWTSNRLLKYNFKGEFIESIPLPKEQKKGVFRVDPMTQQIAVFRLTESSKNAVAYTAKNGKLTNSIPADHLAISSISPYNNELVCRNNSNAWDVMLFRFSNRKSDSLYHYNPTENRLKPVFTTRYASSIPIHSYMELPNHFMGNVSVEKRLTENISVTSDEQLFLVDKQTGKGGFVSFVNDYMADLPIADAFSSFINGYFYMNLSPAKLNQLLEEMLRSNKLSDKQRERWMQLKAQISPNDNNYILYAKLKK